jgi:hypothetical protein
MLKKFILIVCEGYIPRPFRAWLLIIVFTALSSFTYAEMTFTLNTGVNFLNEIYHDNDYKRFLAGFEEQFRFEIYGQNSFVGFFAQDEFGFYFSDEQDRHSGNYFSMAAGPSCILRTGSSRIFASLSIGPMIQWYRETYYVKEVLPYLGEWNSPRSYGAMDMGLIGDLALVLKTSKKFLVRLGLAGEYIFYRSEAGTSIRHIDGDPATDGKAGYTGFVIRPHFGIGLGYLFN